MNAPGLVLTVVVGLLINEATDVSPWLAGRLMRTAARLWTSDRELSAVYAEEWQAFIADRPGKLLKLLTALGFVSAAAARRSVRVLTHGERAVQRAVRFPTLEANALYVALGAGIGLVLSPFVLAFFADDLDGFLFLWFALAVVTAGIVALGVAAALDIRADYYLPWEKESASQAVAEFKAEFSGFHDMGLKSHETATPITLLIRPYVSRPEVPRAAEWNTYGDFVGPMIRPYTGPSLRGDRSKSNPHAGE